MAEETNISFDVNSPGIRGNLFGLTYTTDTASIIIIPVPWEVTVSYGSGTANAPEAILQASVQVDLAEKDIAKIPRVAMLPVSEDIRARSKSMREVAKKLITKVESKQVYDPADADLKTVNESCEKLNHEIKAEALKWLKQNKMLGLVGGDHSTSVGLIRALGEQFNRFCILQIDAHSDLRKSYEGFTYSHASAMFNALKIPAVGKIIQVGVRDYAAEELEMIERAAGRVKVFFDEDIKEQLFTNRSWDAICNDIVSELPQQVYISFDIDGLDPALCPNTGTPVPGGLTYDQAVYLLKKIIKAEKKIIGFDLCEVSPGENDWDANVGARILYQLCRCVHASKQ